MFLKKIRKISKIITKKRIKKIKKQKIKKEIEKELSKGDFF